MRAPYALERGTLCLTFDNMAQARLVGLLEAGSPDPNAADLVEGYPKMLNLLDDLGLKGTFFIEGWNALHHPEHVTHLVERGHEVGVHGWVHENFAQLHEKHAERVMYDAVAAMRLIGLNPTGFRAPGGYRGTALEHMSKLGLDYDSSLDPEPSDDDMTPCMLDDTVAWAPFRWEMVDYYRYHMDPAGLLTPPELEKAWLKLLDDAAENRKLVTLIIHAFRSGTEEASLKAIENVLRRAAGDPRLDVVTGAELSQRIRQGARAPATGRKTAH